jgi:hypothetical protein
MVKHVLGVVGGEGAGLRSEVEEDGIRFPAAQGSDGRFVHTGDEEGGGAAGVEAVGHDALRGDVGDVLDRGGGNAESGSDVAGGDSMGCARGIEVMVQWAVGWCVVLAEVKDTALSGSDWAEAVVAGAAMAEGLATCGVLLVGVGEINISPALHVIRRAL